MATATVVAFAGVVSAAAGETLPHGLMDGHLPLEAVQLVAMPGPDYDTLLKDDVKRAKQGLPLRFAAPNTVSMSPSTHGTWEHLPEGGMMWRMRVLSEGAAHLNFGFDRFDLPLSAELAIYGIDGWDVMRPLTAADNPRGGAFWTRVIHGDEVVIEVTLDAADREALTGGLHLTSINEGYRGFDDPPFRGSSESCNIDVVCPEGDPWANEVPSVGVYTLEGWWTCTGFMVNNTAEDQRPLFMTSHHCGINNGNEGSLVVYWNHQNSYCRAPGSGDSGAPGDGTFNQYSSGCNFLDNDQYYDSALVVLDSAPNPSWGVTYAGWSRANSATNGAGIHHPEAAEKRISFPDVTANEGQYWRVNWGQGRTAPGSSGSPLFDSNHRAIGALCCGSSYCDNDYDDYYGRGFAGAWNGMRSHLDPVGSNPQGIDTLAPGGGADPQGACCIGGVCSYITEHDCLTMGGTYLGDYVSCDGNPCDPNNGNTCETAKVASEGGNAFDTSEMTDSGFGDPDESQCEDTYLDWDDSPDFWFKWSAPGNGDIDLTTCDPSSYDTSVVLYEGLTCETLVQIACNGDDENSDDNCQNYHSLIEEIPVTSGQTYWVRLGGWQGNTGEGTMTLTFNGTSDPTGGCCIGLACVVLTDAQCAAMGGSYLGDGSDCTNDPCGVEAIGYCCISGSCSVLPEDDCDAAGGNYGGDGTNCSSDPCGGGGEYSAVYWNVVGVDLLSSGAPSYTVDVYVELPIDWHLDAVAGNQAQQKTIATNTSFYQDAYGGPTSQGVNPALYPMVPDLEWDSRVTIGCLDSSGDPFPENALNDIGIDWTDFEAGDDLSVGNGAWFVVVADQQGDSQEFMDSQCEDHNGVLIARLTSMGHDSEILFEALFQGRDADNLVWQDTAAATIMYQGELDCNGNHTPDACDIASGDSNDANGNGIPDECESGCEWDLDGNGVTDVNDLLILIAGYPATYDVDDLLALLAEFGCGG